jgi:hypothetical protein
VVELGYDVGRLKKLTSSPLYKRTSIGRLKKGFNTGALLQDLLGAFSSSRTTAEEQQPREDNNIVLKTTCLAKLLSILRRMDKLVRIASR